MKTTIANRPNPEGDLLLLVSTWWANRQGIAPDEHVFLRVNYDCTCLFEDARMYLGDEREPIVVTTRSQPGLMSVDQENGCAIVKMNASGVYLVIVRENGDDGVPIMLDIDSGITNWRQHLDAAYPKANE